MENQDLYIKEALNILKNNNAYFRKVYAASNIETYQILINGDEYYFIIDIPESEDEKNKRDFESQINSIPNVKILISHPGQFAPYGAKKIDDIDKIYDLYEDFDKIFDIIKSLVSSTEPESAPEPSPEPAPGDTDKKENPEEKDYFIHQFKVRDRTKDASSKLFTTAVTDRDLDNYKLLLEFFGYLVDEFKTIHSSKNPQDLYQFVPNNAITPKNIKAAPGALVKSFYIRLEWGPPENRQSKTFHSVSTYWDTHSVETLFNDHLKAKLTPEQEKSFENLEITIKESEDKSRYGTFDFNLIGPSLLESTNQGLRVSQAYQINCFDTEGDEHSFVTVKSKTPIDEYIQRLKLSGFNNIVFNPVNRPGKIQLSDINSSFTSKKEDRNLFKRIFRKK